ncbi:amino-acid permease [Penicillium atrosanguineum]|uniref:Uncharacterized protein n=1 Tax=Penicillium atrosanguineum TaxID=1132637 RepID=A0A9W9QFC4_9EURO|nr:amino-acid permease [Penicillium atrosanguineum]KAJ5313994.1 amino-acid permease [Penicillium atrosanguineum]KAJ5331163.1 hypothetical protein N7476_000946 [Penicillium atrosanguineum]
MYGSNQHDSQPEWRLPAPPHRPVGQFDVPPPQPPRPQVASYSPATYGQISGLPNPSTSPVSGSADSRTWGVRYNNQQQVHPVYAPPPLPPRPSSTNEQPFAYAQSKTPEQPPPLNTSISPPPPGHDCESFTEAQPSFASNIPPPYVPPPAPVPALSGVPPPPPKIPQNSHPAAQQASQPVRPPLLAQGVGPAATLGSYGFRTNTNSASTGPSALGTGTPSDWEHLGHSTADFDDAPWFPDRPPAHQTQDSVYNSPTYGTGMQPQTLNNTATPPPHMDPNQPTRPSSSFPSRPDTMKRNDSISPISPGTKLGSQPFNPTVPTMMGHQSFTPPPRVDSVSSASSFEDHAESIDNVIDAWVQPLSTAPKLAQQAQPAQQIQPIQSERADSTSRPSPTSQSNRSTPVGTSSPIQSNPSVAQDPGVASPAVPTPLSFQGVTPATKTPDPYEDLDPWSKSSLTRYVAMLRKEAVADSDEERFKIFIAFMAKETKLREILYNIEHDNQNSTTAPQPSVPTPKRTLSRPSERNLTIESGLIPVESEEVPSPAATTEYGDDIDDTASEFSSGGRPIQAKLARRGSQWRPKLSTLPGGEDSANNLSSSPSRKFSVDESAEKQVLEPLVSNPPQPIYTPFQYMEGPQRGSDNLTFARPAYEAYSDLRQSAGSGRIMSNAPAITHQSRSGTVTTTPAADEHDETFLGLIRHKSTAYRAVGRPSTTPVPLLPESLRQGRPNTLFEELRSMVWKPLDKPSESSWQITTREGLVKFPDNFSYIQETVDKWNLSAKNRRHRLDEERMARQEESEEQIDDLFNGKEIGYADINTLEEDFRQTEARIQLSEEREEVENFIAKVFNPLDERLKDEISVLRKSYDSALSQLDRDQKEKNSPTEQCSPSVTMNLINDIHRKLELRFQKRLELALDCERRRKKAERRPLVFMGDMASLRNLDGDFNRMEKRNILEAAKDRDDRANRLMDSFDDAILHGLGINQGLLDELASKTARLDATSLRASGLPDTEVEQVLKSAATFATSLQTDSEAILRSSGIADLALNEADYNVAVAEARYSNSEPDILQRLEIEKKKEDDILRKDMDSKLESIQRSPREIEGTIKRLLEDLSKTPRPPTVVPTSTIADDSTPVNATADVPPIIVRPPTAVPTPPSAAASPAQDTDVEHKERLRRALEEAKKRNAARANH